MRIVLILNPASGESSLAANHKTFEENQEHILAALRSYQIEPEVRYTTPEDGGTGIARAVAAQEVDVVIAAGGDGTLHAVAAGLIGTKSALGIIPMGTMNNIAHSLSIPEDIEQACAIIAHGVTQAIDIGKINGHIFLEVAGIGLEAAIFPAAEEFKSKFVTSTLHGIFSGLRTLIAFKPTRYTFSFDHKRKRRFSAIQVSICNSPYYGARLQFAPKAKMDDGLLDVLIYRNYSKLQYILHAISISQGLRQISSRVSRRKIQWLEINAEEPVEIHADGVQIGHTPATITVHPGVLHVRVPQKVASGPNITHPERKRTRIYQRATQTEVSATQQTQKPISTSMHTSEEKGPLHVK